MLLGSAREKVGSVRATDLHWWRCAAIVSRGELGLIAVKLRHLVQVDAAFENKTDIWLL